eukprot:4697549-Ditylum_brightwellii.AAC.1
MPRSLPLSAASLNCKTPSTSIIILSIRGWKGGAKGWGGAKGRGVESREREEAYVAILSKCPRDLHVLRNKYEFGIGGRKAAKNFSSGERGK